MPAVRPQDIKHKRPSEDAAPRPLTGARRLVRRHLAALGLLAALSAGGQVVVQCALRAPQGGAAALAERQRTGCQRLVLDALAIQASETPRQRAGWEADLRRTADGWDRAQRALPPHSNAARAALSSAAAPQQAMLAAARRLLASLPPDTSAPRVDVSRDLTPLFQNQKAYLDAMGAVAGEEERLSAAHLTALKRLQVELLLATLLALAALGAAARRPASGFVCRTLTALSDMEEKQGEQNAALGEADRQLAEMRQVLENLTTVDALTGLINHRAFHEHLDREMGRALRHGHPLSLLLLDVDRFKSYNDSYGHADGDRALRLVSELLKGTARTSDIPARFGGEEFALILTETDMMGATVLGERLRQAVASADGLQRPLTASIGIATLTPNIFSIAALIGQADRALCHAKGDGRNRVSHAHRIPAPLDDEAPAYARAA